jgi:uncharacterized membrane protein
MSAMTTTSARPGWLVPTGLIMLNLAPALASSLRVAKLSAGTDVTPDNAHFFATPLPIVVHVCSATVYLILGAFQFAPGIRRRRPGWHRSAGRLLIPCGIATASSGVWMVLFYPREDVFGEKLAGAFQIGAASAWILFLVLGFAAIRRREVARHRAWMIRAYAIGSGTGTQFFTLGIPSIAAGEPSAVGVAFMLLAGWAINLTVAEWIIRRRTTRRAGVSHQPIPVMETR